VPSEILRSFRKGVELPAICQVIHFWPTAALDISYRSPISWLKFVNRWVSWGPARLLICPTHPMSIPCSRPTSGTGVRVPQLETPVRYSHWFLLHLILFGTVPRSNLGLKTRNPYCSYA
jgi:hypothetical protein